MINTISKPTDIPISTLNRKKKQRICSRCRQAVNLNYLEIKAGFNLSDLRTKAVYIYHYDCIETNHLILQINWLWFKLLYKWERLHYKLRFLYFIGLGFEQVRARVKRKEEKIKDFK